MSILSFYADKLAIPQTEYNLARCGRIMLANLLDETTQLLIDVCIGQSHLTDADEHPTTKREAAASPSYLSYLASSRGQVSEAQPL